MTSTVFDRLQDLLRQHRVSYDVLRHDPVYTSEQAARVRGTSLASGAKALICKADGRHLMFVMPANRRLASKQIRKRQRIRSLRFSSRDEVEQLTSLSPGSIPPFGSLFGLPTWCDEELSSQTRINFNAGDHSISISMTYADYVAIEQPHLGQWAEPA